MINRSSLPMLFLFLFLLFGGLAVSAQPGTKPEPIRVVPVELTESDSGYYSVPVMHFNAIPEPGPGEDGFEMPLAIVEVCPVYPGCEVHSEDQLIRSCFYESVLNHVKENTVLPDLHLEAPVEVRIFIVLHVQPDGRIEVQYVRSKEFPELEHSVREACAGLPLVQPGVQRGFPVKVVFTLPLMLNLE